MTASPTAHHAELERRVLDRLEVRYRDLGYRFYRGVETSEVLPEALRGCVPDAVALGERGNEVIEILGSRRPTHAKVVQMIRERLKGESGWTLSVVHVDDAVDETISGNDSTAGIGALMAEARSLADHYPRAALLLYWSALEGLLRQHEPGLANRPLSARYLVDALDSYDYITSVESEELIRTVAIRNMLVHGQAPTVDKRMLDTLSRVVERLAGAEPESASH